MKKFVTVALAATLAMSFTSASAQEPLEAGIFGDPAGTLSTLAAAPFVPFDIYAVAFDLGGSVLGYEFGIQGLDGLVVLQSVPTVSPAGGLDLGDGDVPGVKEYITTTGACLPEVSGPFVMVRVNVGSFQGANLTDRALCMIAATPSSFDDASGQGAVPGWLRCDGLLTPFGVAQNGGSAYPNGCLILNATQEGPVATEATSFGEIKSRF